MPLTPSLIHRAVVAGLCLAALTSTGCARGQRDASGAAAPGAKGGSEAAPSVDPMGALGYRSEWRGYPQVDAKAGAKSIDVLGDLIAVQDKRNILTVMEPATGKNRWSLDLGSPLMKFVGNARLDNKVLACGESEIQVLDARNGAILERQKLAEIANTRPVISDRIAVFGTSTGEVLGHNLNTGYKLWAYKLGGTVTADPVFVGPSVAVVSQAGDVIVLDPRSGESLGRRRSIFGGLNNNPVANENSVFIAGADQSVWSISDEGRLLWRVRTPDALSAQPAVHEDSVYVSVPSLGFCAFEAASGSRKWATPGVAGRLLAVRNGRLIVWDDAARTLTSLDAQKGDVLDRVERPETRLVTVSAPVDGDLYLVNADGSVDKYSPR